MEQSELEKLIEELESRVDRLRSLYEQYFMGLEKVIPAVAQKDVERRFYVLRRQTIRNTALRFRFQNVLLKYNTYQNYWMRITRQIEEGTYKRDVRRAKARFGTASGGKEREKEREKAGGKALEDDLDLDVEVDLDAELSSFEDEEIARAHAEVARMRAALQGNRPVRGAQPLPPQRPPAPTLADNADDAAHPTERPSPVRLSEPFVEPATEPKIPVAKPAGLTYAVRGTKGGGGGRLPPSFPIAGNSEPPPASVARPRAAAPPAAPPPVAPPAPSRAVPPNATSSARRLSSHPPARTSKPPPAPRPPSMRPRPRPQAPPPVSNLSDERVRQIYTQYVETKRKVGESTAAITYESLSRSLRDSSEKLKQKHGGKNVDFEVAVKDGKAILRPIVK